MLSAMTRLPSAPVMWRAFAGKDVAFDGTFVVAVKTTGIFCRPSCTARKPKPENVEFYGSVKDAMFAGYRACLRCHPASAPSHRRNP